MSMSLFDRPAVLFLPASNPRAIAKARASAADMVILDLEDAVKADDKEAARQAAVEATASPWPMPVGVRINGRRDRHHGDDLEAADACECDFLVLPSVRSPAEVEPVAASISKPLAVMIETAAAVLEARAIAAACQALIAGTNDLAADLRLPSGSSREAMSGALQHIVLSARAEGIAAFDGVFNHLDDHTGFQSEAAESRMLGFDGKSLIHPAQIDPCRAAFAPSEAELQRARRLVSAASGGAERFEGEMVEAMHVDAARRLIERSGG